MAKRQRWREGDFVEIPLPAERCAFARVLKRALVAFYDICSDGAVSLDRVRAANILFKVWVMRSAVTTGRWRIVGHEMLEGDLLEEPEFCKQDMINGKLSIYSSSGGERSASFEEASRLECAAVWDASHLEDRLHDYLEGKSNKWVESLRPVREEVWRADRGK